MSTTSHYAILVDLENCGAKAEMLSHIIERVKIRGDILLGRVYGFTDRYSSLKELLLSNTFSVVPSLRFGHHQKNNLDIQLVIDALEIAYTNELIDSFCIVSGDSDYTPLVGKLKTMGKFVLGISRSEVASNIFINACNEFMFLENVSKQKKKKESKASAEEPLNDQDLAKMVEDDRRGGGGGRALRLGAQEHAAALTPGLQRAGVRLPVLWKAAGAYRAEVWQHSRHQR